MAPSFVNEAVPRLFVTCRLAIGRPTVSLSAHGCRTMWAVNKKSPVRLLVVDDEPHIADLVATVARYEGWHAVTAGTGEDALRAAASFNPDIVVLDLMLPD